MVFVGIDCLRAVGILVHISKNEHIGDIKIKVTALLNENLSFQFFLQFFLSMKNVKKLKEMEYNKASCISKITWS